MNKKPDHTTQTYIFNIKNLFCLDPNILFNRLKKIPPKVRADHPQKDGDYENDKARPERVLDHFH
jgi:hypothetical protein